MWKRSRLKKGTCFFYFVWYCYWLCLLLHAFQITQKEEEDCGWECKVTMDNYFTFHKTMRSLWKHNLGRLERARLNNIQMEDIEDVKDKRFKTLYWINNIDSYWIFIWINNNIVLINSRIYTGHKDTESPQRRPRMNNKNKGHVQLTWRVIQTVKIKIPLLINDYNYCMLWINLVD